MTILRRALRNILRRKSRTVLVSSVLALCVAVVISTVAGVEAAGEATEEMKAEYEGSVQGTLDATERMKSAISIWGTGQDFIEPWFAQMKDSLVGEFSSVEGVEGVVPVIDYYPMGDGGVSIIEEGQVVQPEYPEYEVVGVPLDSLLNEKYHVFDHLDIIAGRNLQEGDDLGVILSEQASGFFDVEVGDSVNLGGVALQVLGIYSVYVPDDVPAPPGYTGPPPEVYLSLERAQELLGVEGRITRLTVYAENVSWVEEVLEGLKELYPQLQANTHNSDKAGGSFVLKPDSGGNMLDWIQKEQEDMLAKFDSDFSDVRGLGIGISLVAGIIGVLMIFGIMFYTVRERTREIGIFKALGFSNREVMKQFLLEGTCFGLIAGLIGLGLSFLIGSALSSWLLNQTETLKDASDSAALSPTIMLAGVGIAVVCGALGSLYPAWRAAHVSPMEALRHG